MLESMTLSQAHRGGLESAVALYEQRVYEAAEFLSARGITEEAAVSNRLGVCVEPAVQEHERFKGMLCIPYLTRAGVVGIKFRALDPERTPKYDSPAGQHARLYNVEALHSKGDTVAVCEGELDALVMTHVVGIPAVGIPGASHWQPHWGRCFDDYLRVLVVADHDIVKSGEDREPPGQKHAKRVCKEIGSSAQLVMPPAGYDLGEWVAEFGPDDVLEACR